MLARSTLRSASLLAAAAAPSARLSAARSSTRSVTTLSKKIYTAHAQATGEGRNGKTFLVDDAGVGGLEIGLSMPKELGGSGKGNNPEQLFGLGYSACFLSALQLVARNAKEKLPADTSVDAAVSIGPPSGAEGFAIAVDLVVKSSLEDKSKLKKLVDEAHKVCPYSNATRNNVPVSISVE